MENMRQYNSYKDSEINWLGAIPSHWKVLHAKRCCQKITDGAHTSPDTSSSDFPFLSVVNLKNNVLDFENCQYTSTKDYLQLLRNGCRPQKSDILFSKDGTIGETFLVNETKEFVVGSSFIIASPAKKLITPEYLKYFLSSAIINHLARVFVKGTGIPRLSIYNFSRLPIFIPSFDEQTTIAEYLDTKTQVIDKKVSLLEKKIGYYQELRKSLIQSVVFRGLEYSNNTLELKDSGISYIQQIPEHWTVERIKDQFYIGRGRVISQEELLHDGKYPVFSSQTENNGCLGFIATYDFDTDLLTWTTDGVNAGTVFKRSGKFSCTNVCGTLKPKRKNLDLGYAAYALHISASHNKRIDTNGAKIMNGEMAVIQIPFPPLNEQKEIAKFLDAKLDTIAKIIANIQTQITTLKELRKTLINDVVTGKIKVSHE